MQFNVHTPERGANETREAYKDRRVASAARNDFNRGIGFGGATSRQQLRDAQRKSGAMAKVAGSYGRGLRNWITQKQAAAAA